MTVTQPPLILLVHADALRLSAAEIEADPVVSVLKAFGGRRLPFSALGQIVEIPAVLILQTADWEQWRGAAKALKGVWQHAALLGVFDEHITEDQSLKDLVLGDLNDFLYAPVREEEMRARLGRLIEFSSGKLEVPPLQAFKKQHQLASLLGDSEVFERTLRKIPLLAASDATVLIGGETGTGKELVARALHYGGRRSSGPFVPCNCGALPDHLFENELFGHAPGAFTDARTEQKGLLKLAHGGTLFLDEIDSLSVNGQSKLLRFLQDKQYRPLGSSQTCHADVRVLAATNANLEDLVFRKLFREDLFHRLNVLHITVPPLRERAADIPGLAHAFLKRFSKQHGSRRELRFDPDAFHALQAYHWPGNVRELESVVQRVAVMTESSIIRPVDLELPGAAITRSPDDAFEQAKRRAMEGFERGYLTRLLSKVEGNVSRGAMEAGKDRRTFQRMLRKRNLNATDFHRQVS